MFAEVLTSAASWNSEQPLLTYIVPGPIEREVRVGQLVAIPYGERLVEGIIWKLAGDRDDEGTAHVRDADTLALRPISEILDLEPALLPHQRELAEWMAAYYVTPLAQVAQTMLPP